MKRFTTIAGGAAAVLLAGTISASATPVYNAVNGPVTYTAVQGPVANGDAVSTLPGGSYGERSDVTAVFDGDPGTFFSLGIGGTLTADVSPLLLASGSVVEVTFNTPNTNYNESAEVYLGGDLLGVLSNQAGAYSVTQPGIGSITKIAQGGATTSWEISVLGAYSSIMLKDITDGSNNAADNDGFDVGEFSVSTVPLPASLLMLLGALGGLGVISRRRKTA